MKDGQMIRTRSGKIIQYTKGLCNECAYSRWNDKSDPNTTCFQKAKEDLPGYTVCTISFIFKNAGGSGL